MVALLNKQQQREYNQKFTLFLALVFLVIVIPAFLVSYIIFKTSIVTFGLAVISSGLSFVLWHEGYLSLFPHERRALLFHHLVQYPCNDFLSDKGKYRHITSNSSVGGGAENAIFPLLFLNLSTMQLLPVLVNITSSFELAFLGLLSVSFSWLVFSFHEAVHVKNHAFEQYEWFECLRKLHYLQHIKATNAAAAAAAASSPMNTASNTEHLGVLKGCTWDQPLIGDPNPLTYILSPSYELGNGVLGAVPAPLDAGAGGEEKSESSALDKTAAAACEEDKFRARGGGGGGGGEGSIFTARQLKMLIEVKTGKRVLRIKSAKSQLRSVSDVVSSPRDDEEEKAELLDRTILDGMIGDSVEVFLEHGAKRKIAIGTAAAAGIPFSGVAKQQHGQNPATTSTSSSSSAAFTSSNSLGPAPFFTNEREPPLLGQTFSGIREGPFVSRMMGGNLGGSTGMSFGSSSSSTDGFGGRLLGGDGGSSGGHFIPSLMPFTSSGGIRGHVATSHPNIILQIVLGVFEAAYKVTKSSLTDNKHKLT